MTSPWGRIQLTTPDVIRPESLASLPAAAGEAGPLGIIHSLVSAFCDARLIDDFPKPVHSTHGTMFGERVPRIE
jgi:hypothetical protein